MNVIAHEVARYHGVIIPGVKVINVATKEDVKDPATKDATILGSPVNLFVPKYVAKVTANIINNKIYNGNVGMLAVM